jgi:hypothetical protein
MTQGYADAMSTSTPSEPAGTVAQHQLPRHYRLAATCAAVLLLAGGFVGALKTPGVIGLVGYGVSAVVAGATGYALFLATRRNRGYQSTQTTALTSGLFFLLALVDVLMIVTAVVLRTPGRIVEFRFGILLVTVLLALIIAGIGIFGVAWGQRSRAHIPPATPEQAQARIAQIAELADAEHAMAEGEATREQEAKVIQDAARREREHRRLSWSRARDDQRNR